jgi:hypothetical protein
MSSSHRGSRELTPPPSFDLARYRAKFQTVRAKRVLLLPRSGRYKRSAPITSEASSIIAAGGYGKAGSGRAWVALSLPAGGWVPACLVSEQQKNQEQDWGGDQAKADDQRGASFFLRCPPHFKTPSAFFHWLPWAGKPTTNFRSCLAHIPQVAHVTLSFRVAGQVNTGVPSSSRWNAGALCGSTVTSGKPCFRRLWACRIPFADKLTVKPSLFAFLTAARLAGVGGLCV